MRHTVKFSIIIPFYNREKFLHRTLESVLLQTIRPLEIILVDNASTDNSVAVCQEFITKHSSHTAPNSSLKISLLSEPIPGAARARNTGLSAASGDWIYFFDSDDEMSADFLIDVQKAINSSTENLDFIAAATRMQFSDGSQKTRKVYYNASVSTQILTGMLATQGMVFRKDFLQRIEAWNPTLLRWNDWELGIRTLLARPRMTWLTKKVYHTIYQHSDSITGSNFSNSYEALKTVLNTVNNLLIKERPKHFKALQFRAAILAAQLHREHHPEMSTEIYSSYCHTPNLIHKLQLSFIYHYTRLGGRGSWWIARLLV